MARLYARTKREEEIVKCNYKQEKEIRPLLRSCLLVEALKILVHGKTGRTKMFQMTDGIMGKKYNVRN